jgi:hypothetical protein
VWTPDSRRIVFASKRPVTPTRLGQRTWFVINHPEYVGRLGYVAAGGGTLPSPVNSRTQC